MNFCQLRSEISAQHTRRNLLLGLFLIGSFGYSTSAIADREFDIKDKNGSSIDNFRMPVELDPVQLPGLIWKGDRAADCQIYEFFDYNCGYCREAGRKLDEIITGDPGVRLGLVNNPMLSIGSFQAAKIQQGLLRLYGPAIAYDFHIKMLERHGPATGPSALEMVRLMGLDLHKIVESANNSIISDIVARQSKLAVNAGMTMTPSFVISNTVIMGWPGEGSIREMISAVRKCAYPACK